MEERNETILFVYVFWQHCNITCVQYYCLDEITAKKEK